MRRTDGPWPVWEIIPEALYQRGKLTRLDSDTKASGIQHYGITWAVSLAPRTPDLDLVGWDLIGLMKHDHLPIPDGKLSADLVPLAVKLAAHIEDGGRIMTMCNAGRNRSGLLSALVVREVYGISGDLAASVVQKQRPNALANDHFTSYLAGLE